MEVYLESRYPRPGDDFDWPFRPCGVEQTYVYNVSLLLPVIDKTLKI